MQTLKIKKQSTTQNTEGSTSKLHVNLVNGVVKPNGLGTREKITIR